MTRNVLQASSLPKWASNFAIPSGIDLVKQKNKPKSRSKVRFAEVDLNEDQASITQDTDEEEEGDDAEFIDILDILDGRGEPDHGSEDEMVKRALDVDPNEGDSEETDSEDDVSEEETGCAFAPDDDEDLAPEALDELNNFISGLDPSSQKRKSIPDDAESNVDSRPRKRRMLKEQNETGPESEFRTQPSGLFNSYRYSFS